MYGRFETAKLGHPNKMDNSLRQRLAYVGCGKEEKNFCTWAEKSSMLFVVSEK
jgi:hypothetical protein